MKNYRVLINKQTYEKTVSYLEQLKSGNIEAGKYLQDKLKEHDIFSLKTVEFLELLMRTKQPQIFAESAVYGDGSDWNQEELSLLGDISIATPVTVYDNGSHYQPQIHKTPFPATLLFTPGALLQNGCNVIPADWQEVTSNGKINPEKYYQLHERRLLPPFTYANEVAKNKGKMALVEITGLGCGQFARCFRGKLGSVLKINHKIKGIG